MAKELRCDFRTPKIPCQGEREARGSTYRWQLTKRPPPLDTAKTAARHAGLFYIQLSYILSSKYLTASMPLQAFARTSDSGGTIPSYTRP